MDNDEVVNDELMHYGVKGMKWGVRRYQNEDGSLTPAGKKKYRSIDIRSAMARRSNEKIDKSFNKWHENDRKKSNAIDLGKKANADRMTYEGNRSDKSLKKAYKQSNKEYRKALRSNTTYRKGDIRQQVGRDASRKYLNEAKRVKKQLDKDPSNKNLQKQYNKLMSKHDVERAKARRATEVAAKRSTKKASIKRNMTKTIKAAATTAAVGVGIAAVNKYAANGKLNIKPDQVVNAAKKVKKFLGFVY